MCIKTLFLALFSPFLVHFQSHLSHLRCKTGGFVTQSRAAHVIMDIIKTICQVIITHFVTKQTVSDLRPLLVLRGLRPLIQIFGVLLNRKMRNA